MGLSSFRALEALIREELQTKTTLIKEEILMNNHRNPPLLSPSIAFLSAVAIIVLFTGMRPEKDVRHTLTPLMNGANRDMLDLTAICVPDTSDGYDGATGGEKPRYCYIDLENCYNTCRNAWYNQYAKIIYGGIAGFFAGPIGGAFAVGAIDAGCDGVCVYKFNHCPS